MHPMRVDLHMHTTASDGAWAPEAVVRAAVAGGLDVIAVTDHDTTAGVPAALAAARESDLRVVPAVELSTTRDGREVHILAYFVNPESEALRDHEARARTTRLARMATMLARLRAGGVHLDMDAVLSAAGGGSGVVGRPHLAQALVTAGYVDSISNAFDRYIGDEHPAFEPTALLDPVAAVALASEAGGIAVWAHPPGDLMDRLLPELVRAGLRGIEVYRPYSSAAHIRRLQGIADTAGLFATGGSDWHSPERHEPLGTFHLPWDRIAPFLQAGGL